MIFGLFSRENMPQRYPFLALWNFHQVSSTKKPNVHACIRDLVDEQITLLESLDVNYSIREMPSQNLEHSSSRQIGLFVEVDGGMTQFGDINYRRDFVAGKLSMHYLSFASNFCSSLTKTVNFKINNCDHSFFRELKKKYYFATRSTLRSTFCPFSWLSVVGMVKIMDEVWNYPKFWRKQLDTVWYRHQNTTTALRIGMREGLVEG